MKKLLIGLVVFVMAVQLHAQDAITKTLHDLNDVAKIKNKVVGQKVTLDGGNLKGTFVMINAMGSVYEPDGGVVLSIPGTDNFMLLRDISQSHSINPEWFGFKSDDSTAANTNSQILRKIFARYNNVTLDFQKDYWIADTIFIKKKNSKFNLNGSRLLQRWKDSLSSVLWVDTNAVNTEIWGGEIIGSTGLIGVAGYARNRASIECVAHGLYVHDMTVQKQNGILTRNVNNVTLRNINLYVTQKAVHFWADSIYQCKNLIIDGCFATTIKGVSNDNQIRGFKTTNADNVVITNSEAYGFQLSLEWFSYYVVGGKQELENNTIQVNNFKTDRWVSFVYGTVQASNILVDGVNLRPQFPAPEIDESTHAVELTGLRYFNLNNIIIRNYPSDGIFCIYGNSNYAARNTVKNGTINNVEMYNCGTASQRYKAGIVIGNGVNIDVTNVKMRQMVGEGIVVAGTNDHRVKNINIDHFTFDTGWNALVIYNAENIKVVNSAFKNSAREAVQIGANTTTFVKGLEMHNNLFENDSLALEVFEAAIDYDITGNTFKGNRRDYMFYNAKYGRFFNNAGVNIPYSAFAPVVRGTWNVGEQILTAPDQTTGERVGKICTQAGTMDSIKNLSGTSLGGDSTITLSRFCDSLYRGMYVSINGTGTYRITYTDGNTVKVNDPLTSFTDAAITYSNAVFVNIWNPNNVISGGHKSGGTIDFNSFTSSSFISSIDEDNVNAPLPGRFWMLVNSRYGNGMTGSGKLYGTQIATRITGVNSNNRGETYIRVQSNGTWFPWQRLDAYAIDTTIINGSTGEMHGSMDRTQYISATGSNNYWGKYEKFIPLLKGSGRYGFRKFVATDAAGTAVDSILLRLDGTVYGSGDMIAGRRFKTASMPNGTSSDSIVVWNKADSSFKKIAPIKTDSLITRWQQFYDSSGMVGFNSNGDTVLVVNFHGGGSQATSGAFTSTLTNTTNITSSTFTSATYTKIGDVVTVRITGALTPTAATTATVLGFTLPVNPGGATQYYAGTIVFSDNAGTVGYLSGHVDVNASSGTAHFISGSTTTSGNFTIIIQYIISNA